jgi:hypothetical protein
MENWIDMSVMIYIYTSLTIKSFIYTKWSSSFRYIIIEDKCKLKKKKKKKKTGVDLFYMLKTPFS